MLIASPLGLFRHGCYDRLSIHTPWQEGDLLRGHGDPPAHPTQNPHHGDQVQRAEWRL